MNFISSDFFFHVALMVMHLCINIYTYMYNPYVTIYIFLSPLRHIISYTLRLERRVCYKSFTNYMKKLREEKCDARWKKEKRKNQRASEILLLVANFDPVFVSYTLALSRLMELSYAYEAVESFFEKMPRKSWRNLD